LASERLDITDQAGQAAAQECMPCGARGTLISKLGGQESTVQCPWCEGSGQRRPGIDAQAHWGPASADGTGGPPEPAVGA
jgi:hypothetical protein